MPAFTLDGETFDGLTLYREIDGDALLPKLDKQKMFRGVLPIWFDRATGITDKRYELRPRFRESNRGVVFTTLVAF